MVRITLPSLCQRFVTSVRRPLRCEHACHSDVIWNLYIDSERRRRFAPIHLDLHLVGLERDVPADDGDDFFAQDTQQIGAATRGALVREQDLQAFARYRRGAASKEAE